MRGSEKKNEGERDFQSHFNFSRMKKKKLEHERKNK